MGWTGEYMKAPLSGKALDNHLLLNFIYSGWKEPTEVLAHKLVDGAWYAKVKSLLKDGSTRIWFAVTLVKWEDGYLWTKEMDNTVGPCADDCPVSWFKGVPVETEFDREWRERCRAKQRRI